MPRRYFDFLYQQLCLELERRLSRYDLWLLLWDAGGDPDELDHEQARRFLAGGLDTLLREEGHTLDPRARRRLTKRVLAFDPRHPTPEEWAAGLTPGARSTG